MDKNIDSAFYECQSEKFIRTDDFDKAAITCKRLIKMNPKSSYDSHYRWALIRRDQEEYRLAELKFREVTILNPQNPLAFNNLADVLSKQGKYDQAIPLFKKGLMLCQDDLNLTHNLAICYTEKGDYKEAIKYYEKALKIQPSDASTHNCIGYMLFLQGKYMKAIGKFNDAIQNDPQYEIPYFNKAMALFCQSGSMKEEAKSAFELGIQALPGLSIMKLNKLKFSVSVYNRERDRVKKQLECDGFKVKARIHLEKIQKGLEYILSLLRVEIEKLEKREEAPQSSSLTLKRMSEKKQESSGMRRFNCFKSCIDSITKRFK